uniref:Matrix protein n=3 Tax=unclassified Sigmavirus TaxID=1802944 RepID=A0AAU7L0D1_9RHAB
MNLLKSIQGKKESPKKESDTVSQASTSSLTNPFLPPTNLLRTYPSPSICQAVKLGKWKINSQMRLSLSIAPSKFESIMRILEVIEDEYQGNQVFEPLIKTIYWLLGLHLIEISGPSNSFTFASQLNELITIKHRYAMVHDQEFSHIYNTNGNFRGVEFAISFTVKFVPTKRHTVPLERYIPIKGKVQMEIPQFGIFLQGVNISNEANESEFILT